MTWEDDLAAALLPHIKSARTFSPDEVRERIAQQAAADLKPRIVEMATAVASEALAKYVKSVKAQAITDALMVLDLVTKTYVLALREDEGAAIDIDDTEWADQLRQRRIGAAKLSRDAQTALKDLLK